MSHTLQRLPDVVTVQIKLDDGYVSDGQGTSNDSKGRIRNAILYFSWDHVIDH